MLLWIGLGAVAGWLCARHLAVGGLGLCLMSTTVLPLATFLVTNRFDLTILVAHLLFSAAVQVAYFLTNLSRESRVDVAAPRLSVPGGTLGAA
ncbi:hypothetical protein EYW49_04695 [Siculibacillus lacustris]|uniref:Uncharacterized protein n=1 Tax=Siculibacillus lacustris TaxID=1549641 RepID=A0A4Q9VVY7_9HYPH|nr:hypothetical protein [Siculibacillus lacustris]TBW39973.1 hypothetical protein EYW49_04695 [Siculibacillus lacustris]